VLADRGPAGPGLAARIEAGLVEATLALDQGEAERALRLADDVLRDVPVGVHPEARAWLQLRREQAAIRLDRPARPGTESDLGALVPDHLRRALARTAAGAPAAVVDAGFAAALSQAERGGIPDDIAEVVLAYGDWLLHAGRHADAAAIAGRAAAWTPQVPALAELQQRIDARPE
jgi:hypothetical protein